MNIVAPTAVDSAPLHNAVREQVEKQNISIDQAYEKLLSQSALRELLQVDGIAESVIFLLSEGARQISGQSLSVDGCTSRLN